MSYLRGPITLGELSNIAVKQAPTSDTPAEPSDSQHDPETEGSQSPPPTPKGYGQSFLDPRIVFHTRLEGYFEPYQEPTRADGKILYRPALRAVLRLKFDESKEDFVLHQRHHFVAYPIHGAVSVTSKFKTLPLEDDDLLSSPAENAVFTDLPIEFDEEHELKQAEKELVDHLYRSLTATRFINRKVKLYSRPDEDREAFLQRCIEGAEQMADAAAVKVRKSLESKIARLSKKLDKSKQKAERLAITEKGQKLEGVWKAGEMLLSLFSKRRRSFSTVLGSSRRAMEADSRTKHAEDEVQKLQEEILDLQDDLETRLDELEAEHATLAENIEDKEIRLEKSDILVERFEIMWVPVSKRI